MGSTLSSLYPSSFASPPLHLPPLPPPPAGPPSQVKYDVFLSFRGEDTRYNLITHIHKALDERGISTFIDYNLNRGDEISPALLTAIEESRISIIIFSKNYASSKWCLEELAKILECKNRGTNEQIAIPVFYGVTPSDLRSIQRGSFADAFAMHEKRFKQNLEQVHSWKDALNEAADLSGWTSSSDRSEAGLVEDIVEDVCKKLGNLSSSDTSNLVGIDSKIKEIESLLCMGTDDVRSVGIWGIGGIGKTTLAEAVFNKISSQFEGCSYFARNVRERSEERDGLNRLQQELLSALLGDKHVNMNTFVVGRTFIKNRLSCKRILIVFDDVSDFKQIEGLIGGFDCLGPRSRIIITTRDKQVLTNYDVNQIYRLQELFDHEALELFSMYAFKSKHPAKDYMEQSKRVVKYAGGIPLALKVLGSFLYKRKIMIWESAIEKMRREPNMDIHKVLKISYDALDNEVQKIFLDIACFFKWSDIEHVISTLKACGFHPEIGIDILIDKSLITISHGIIQMHDLLELMGKEIVRQESTDPDKRSRLWDHEEIYHLLTKSMGTETIEGIALDISKIRESIMLNPSDFIKMRRLRILKFYSSSCEGKNRVHISQSLKYNIPALKYLSWHGCAVNSPLSSFSLENLVILDMRGSKVEQLWKDALPLAKLKEIDLSHSHLTSCPNLSGSPNLKKLNLSHCPYLYEISPSMGCLSELDLLDLSTCFKLKAIPDLSGLISLRDLFLFNCSNLETLHEMPCNLERFYLSSNVIEELPPSFGNLTRLQSLTLHCCEKLKRLPTRICKSKSLQTLYLDGCLELDQLPNEIGSLNSLKILSAKRTRIREFSSSLTYLKKLEELSFNGLEVQWPNRSDCDSMADGKELSKDDLDDKLFPDCKVYVDLSNWEMVKCLPSNAQLSGRRGSGIAVQVLSSLSFQDFDDKVKNVLHALQKVKEACVVLQYPGSEVPEWFNFRSTGYFINLSPNWLNQSFMGFALCIVVAPYPEPCTAEYTEHICWFCKLKSKDGQSSVRHGDFCASIRGSNHVLVNAPILPFPPHTLCDAKEISFEIGILDLHYKIEKCGVHLMYTQYFEEVDEGSHVVADANVLSLVNVHDNYEEVDEPQPTY